MLRAQRFHPIMSKQTCYLGILIWIQALSEPKSMKSSKIHQNKQALMLLLLIRLTRPQRRRPEESPSQLFKHILFSYISFSSNLSILFLVTAFCFFNKQLKLLCTYMWSMRPPSGTILLAHVDCPGHADYVKVS